MNPRSVLVSFVLFFSVLISACTGQAVVAGPVLVNVDHVFEGGRGEQRVAFLQWIGLQKANGGCYQRKGGGIGAGGKVLAAATIVEYVFGTPLPSSHSATRTAAHFLFNNDFPDRSTVIAGRPGSVPEGFTPLADDDERCVKARDYLRQMVLEVGKRLGQDGLKWAGEKLAPVAIPPAVFETDPRYLGEVEEALVS